MMIWDRRAQNHPRHLAQLVPKLLLGNTKFEKLCFYCCVIGAKRSFAKVRSQAELGNEVADSLISLYSPFFRKRPQPL